MEDIVFWIWNKKPKPSLWYRFKMLWISTAMLLATIPTFLGTYQYLQPDFGHFQEHFNAKSVLFPNGSFLIFAEVSHLPNADTTVQIIVDNSHIHHLHFPEGIPEEYGKQFNIGKQTLQIPTQINFKPIESKVTIRFIFKGKFSLGSKIFSTTADIYDGSNLTEEDGVIQNNNNNNIKKEKGIWIGSQLYL